MGEFLGQKIRNSSKCPRGADCENPEAGINKFSLETEAPSLGYSDAGGGVKFSTKISQTDIHGDMAV